MLNQDVKHPIPTSSGSTTKPDEQLLKNNKSKLANFQNMSALPMASM